MCVKCRQDNCKGCGYENPQGAYNVVANVLKNFQLQNPIPDEVQDNDIEKLFFSKYKLVPYSGTHQCSSHTILKYINNLSVLSPTLSSCINAIGFYGFGGKIDVVKSDNSEFDLSDIADVLSNVGEVDQVEAKKRFISSISNIKMDYTWNGLATALYTSYKTNGNAYLEVVIHKFLDERKVEFIYHDPKHVLYKLGNTKSVLISKSWEETYMMKKPPREVVVYPNYSESNSEVRTIIHLKHGTGDYYGRPDWWGCNYDAFLEIKNKEYLLKSVHNSFTGLVLVEFEGDQLGGGIDDEDAKENGWQNTAQRFAHNFTNQGEKPSSVMITERPSGATPVHVHEFKPNTNEKYFTSISKLCEDQIVKVNNWSKKLLGISGNTGISNEAFVSELKSKIPIIEYYQNLIDNNIINKAFDFVGNITGNQDFVNFNIKHKSALDPIIKDQIKETVITKQIANDSKLEDGNISK